MFGFARPQIVGFAVMVALMIAAPLLQVYPVFLMKVLCFALFACAFNLLLGYVGLLSFGHAAYFGWAAYVTALTVEDTGAAARDWAFSPAA